MYSSSELYRRLHNGNPGDLDFYRRIAGNNSRVLELGCGWGRVSAVLAKSGCHVHGLDNNRQFLTWAEQTVSRNALSSHCKFSLVDLARSGWRSELEKPFDFALLPYNTLYALGGANNVLSCLRETAACLKPDGELWLDVYPVDELQEARDQEEELPDDDDEPVACWTDKGCQVTVTEKTEFVPGRQQLSVVYSAFSLHPPLANPGSPRRLGELRMTHDYLLLEQIADLMHDADFQSPLVTRGFSSGKAPAVIECSSAGQPPLDGEGERGAGAEERAEEPADEWAQVIFGAQKK